MKNIIPISFLIIFFLFFGCKNKETRIEINEIISHKMRFSNPDDSLWLDETLRLTLLEFEEKSKDDFHGTLRFVKKDSLIFGVDVVLNYGNIFSENEKHLLVRRNCKMGSFINVYTEYQDSLYSILVYEERYTTIGSDKIVDFNNDGAKDLRIYYSPSSGCCPRNNASIFLYNPQLKSFNKEIVFINPTFFPEGKLVNGV